jgi:hypothetical protein|eukprot:COSAG06_NODE_307_length_17801_cov_6.184386_5_plen_124_part_00
MAFTYRYVRSSEPGVDDVEQQWASMATDRQGGREAGAQAGAEAAGAAGRGAAEPDPPGTTAFHWGGRWPAHTLAKGLGLPLSSFAIFFRYLSWKAAFSLSLRCPSRASSIFSSSAALPRFSYR